MKIKVNRYYFLDNLKVALTVLVILHHIMIVYGGEGAFQITSKTQGGEVFNLIMTGGLAINQSYFMGLFFMISAIFSYASLKKKGSSKFIKSKVKRLLIPALLYFVFISPLISLYIDLMHRNIGVEDLQIRFSIGALWFLLALFMFDCLYAVLSSRLDMDKYKIHFDMWTVMFMILGVTIITWIIRMVYPVGKFIPIVSFQPGHFAQYTTAYYLGIQISKNKWLDKLQTHDTSKYLYGLLPVIALMLLVVYQIVLNIGDIQYAFGGLNHYAFLYSLFDQLMFCFASLGLIGLFYKHFDRKNIKMEYLSTHAFGAYITHTISIVLTVNVLNLLPLGHGLSFLITIIIAVPLSFMLGKTLTTCLVSSPLLVWKNK